MLACLRYFFWEILMLFKKKKKDLEELRDITDDVEESDFVPYACHYDAKTILTKNGELMQVIRIVGKAHSYVDEAHDEGLRAKLRLALKKYIPSDSYALWFHVVRREINCALPLPPAKEGCVLHQLHTAWERDNHFSRQYVSEMYVSVVREGQDSDKITVQDFVRGILPSRDIKWRNRFLDTIFVELNAVTENICNALQDYGARVLGMYELEGEKYSEVQEFLEKIINLVDRKMPVADIDLAYYLTTGEITFGFNAMEVRRSDGRRRFASILTLKEYKEASLKALDNFLNNPIECIVTQCVDFINPEVAKNLYKEQKFLISVSEEPTLSEAFEIDHILDGSTGNPIDFGQQQVLIFLIADSIRQLEVYVRRALGYLANVGLVAIREDIHFEECYWAQLPGNFEFIRRLTPTYTDHVGGFMNVQRYPVGLANGNRWGDAVTVLNAASKTPYFFNFHDGMSGHTLVVGQNTKKLDDVVRFLMVMAQKYEPKIFFVGVSDRYEKFVDSLDVHAVATQAEVYGLARPLNPFLLQREEHNVAFIYRWVILLFSSIGLSVTEELKSDVKQCLEKEEYKKFDDFISAFLGHSPQYKETFAPFTQGKYAHIFNAEQPIASYSNASWGLKGIADDSILFAAYVSLLIQQISDCLDGHPTIILLEDGLDYLKYTHVARDLSRWLDGLTHNNAIILLTATTHPSELDAALVSVIPSVMATSVFLGCKNPFKDYAVFGVTASECEHMGLMNLDENQFLIKKRDESLISGIKLPENFSFTVDARKK
jgi:type IV secretion system protein VirB4